MSARLNILLISSILMMTTLNQDIVDFTYSQYDQQQGKAIQKSQTITIRPSKDIIQGYSFPQACYLSKKLEQVKLEDSHEVDSYDMDSMIESLKYQFIQMLKVSQKIKKKRNNIEELSEMSGRSDNVTVVRPNQLEALKRQEEKLANLNDQINSKSRQLQLLVQQSMRNSGGNQFAISAVNFQIQSLKLKLGYLKNLRNSNDATSSKAKDDYDKFFTQLKRKFDEENDLVNDLNTILQNYNQIEELRSKILNLKGKIAISDLMIEEKQACKKQKDQIQKFQKNDLQIKAHMSSLRQKKKDKSNVNNKFCEGVANKLLDRVKKVLQSYSYTFQCAQGLDLIQQQRDLDRSLLQKAQNRLRYLQKNVGFDEYKRKFDQNRQYIKNKQDELSKFSITQYSHDINQLDRLIKKATDDLQDAQQRKRKLGSPSANKDVDYRRIQDLVFAIKKLKGTYCQDYEKYENRAQELWKLVQKYEAEVQYSSKIRGIYEEQINQLRNLQITFDNLRSKILQRIQ